MKSIIRKFFQTMLIIIYPLFCNSNLAIASDFLIEDSRDLINHCETLSNMMDGKRYTTYKDISRQNNMSRSCASFVNGFIDGYKATLYFDYKVGDARGIKDKLTRSKFICLPDNFLDFDEVKLILKFAKNNPGFLTLTSPGLLIYAALQNAHPCS